MISKKAVEIQMNVQDPAVDTEDTAAEATADTEDVVEEMKKEVTGYESELDKIKKERGEFSIKVETYTYG